MRFSLQTIHAIQLARVENLLIVWIKSEAEGGIIGKLLHLTRCYAEKTIGSRRIQFFRNAFLQSPTGLSDFWYRLKSTCGGIQTK